MGMKRIAGVVLVVLLMMISACAGGLGNKGTSGSQSHPLLRQVAPDTEVKLKNGGAWRPGDASGKVLVIDFWATWCGPCKESFPRIDAIYKKHANGGLEVMAVDEDEDTKKVPSFLQETGASFPIALDPGGTMATAFGVNTMPSEFIVDKRGVVRYVHSGYHPDEMEAIDDEVKELLKEQP